MVRREAIAVGMIPQAGESQRHGSATSSPSTPLPVGRGPIRTSSSASSPDGDELVQCGVRSIEDTERTVWHGHRARFLNHMAQERRQLKVPFDEQDRIENPAGGPDGSSIEWYGKRSRLDRP